jgi:hypothetical protein
MILKVLLLISLPLLAGIERAEAGPFSKSNVCSTQMAFEKLVRSSLPAGCALVKGEPAAERYCVKLNTDGAFGYYAAYSRADSNPPEIAYELQVHIDAACLSTLRNRFLSKDVPPLLVGRRPIRIEALPNADGGPTLMFYFKATSSDLKDVEARGQ